jgi:hypothetical protein
MEAPASSTRKASVNAARDSGGVEQVDGAIRTADGSGAATPPPAVDKIPSAMAATRGRARRDAVVIAPI